MDGAELQYHLAITTLVRGTIVTVRTYIHTWPIRRSLSFLHYLNMRVLLLIKLTQTQKTLHNIADHLVYTYRFQNFQPILTKYINIVCPLLGAVSSTPHPTWCCIYDSRYCCANKWLQIRLPSLSGKSSGVLSFFDMSFCTGCDFRIQNASWCEALVP